MSTYKELLLQQRKLNQQIAQARDDDAAAALARVVSLVAEFGFTAQQVFPWTPEPVKRERHKAEVKFRNPVTGAGWSGRGREPRWLAGKDRSAYAVLPQQDQPS
jgi:DNA-binding protein H-NS